MADGVSGVGADSNTLLKKLRQLVRYIIPLFASVTAAVVLTPTLWASNPGTCHTLLELICIFVTLLTFFVIWYNYKHDLSINHLVGFSFLIVSVFHIFHIYYFPSLKLYPPGRSELFLWYWLLGLLVEGAVFLVYSLKCKFKNINRWFGLSASILFGAVLSCLLFYIPHIPPLSISGKPTLLKNIIEYIIILLFAASACLLAGDIKKADLKNRYIFVAMLAAILSEFFLMFTGIFPAFYNILGHTLKVSYYHFLFKGIFENSVIYPYKELDGTKKHMTNILDHLPIGLTTYDSDEKISFVNKKGLGIIGYTLEELMGEAAEQMYQRLYGSGNTQMSLPGRKPAQGSIKTIETNDGTHVKLKVDVVGFSNGGVLLLYDDAKKEQELKKLKLQTETILNAVNSNILIVDKDNKIIMCNKAFANTVEMDMKNILGKDFHEFNRMLQLEEELPRQNLSNGNNKSAPLTATLTTPNGNRKEFLLHSSPVTNVEGEIIGTISVSSEITGFKDEQRRLQQQEKLALLGQMGSSIVHETKNLLTTIKGCCQIIEMRVRDEHIKKYIHKINNMTNDVNRVITDFMALSKPRSLVFTSTSLNDLLRSMRFMLESSSLTRGVNIDFLFSEQEMQIMCDEGQIKQVILNIAKNAIEAMADCEKPLLSIYTYFDPAAETMSVIISDNGNGMSEEDKAKLGTPFFSTKRTGTGLGLSVCFQIIKDHGGRIEVESKLGKGTIFKILLPCRVMEETG